MQFVELKAKALSLPYLPGVYIMKDRSDTVIYVGKAKKLKNRVSQYFQDTASHSAKTRLMVSRVDHFEVIVAASEFEALVLECTLIKQHQPKYNILLKDDKGFPYLRLDAKETYPKITMVSSIRDDGAEYFGPFGGRGATSKILEAIGHTLKLPNCNKDLSKDTGKGRPCLHYHLKQCEGWCQNTKTLEEYRYAIEQARQLLSGNYKVVLTDVRNQMLKAADEQNFELAAVLRDRLNSIENLGRKQLVAGTVAADTDVIGYAQTETMACFSVLHFSEGRLLDKEYQLLPVEEDSGAALSSLVKQYYFNSGSVPKVILLPSYIEDQDMVAQLLQQKLGKKVSVLVPKRGKKTEYIQLANKNAYEEAYRVTDKTDKYNSVLLALGKMLGIAAPKRIESFDVSNICGTDIVASMVVFCSGKPKRSEYKRFKITDIDGQDDYASMKQAVLRRYTHYLQGDNGFSKQPDLVLIDGGVEHAKIARQVLDGLNLPFPVFGMVKDDRHRTRALVTPFGDEIRIDAQQTIFALIGCVQEETHRFAVAYHRQLRSKRLRYSELDNIQGIGAKRKELLLKNFKSLAAIMAASLQDLEHYLPKPAAMAVYYYFNSDKNRG